jgi:hypothetical protein
MGITNAKQAGPPRKNMNLGSWSRVKLHLDTYLRRRVPAIELTGVGMLAA